MASRPTPSRPAAFSGRSSSGSSSPSGMLATFSGISGGRRAEADQRDVVGLLVAGGELADVLEDRLADVGRTPLRLDDAPQQPTVIPRVVEVLLRVARVGHAVGVDH